MEEVIRSEDPKLIKTRRDTIQEGMTSIEKSMRRLLARIAGKFDHGKIPRLQVQSENESLKKFHEEFEIIHKAYLQYGMDDDIEGESPEFQVEMKLTSDVKDGFYESLHLYVDYEESYKIYKAAFPDPNLVTNYVKEVSMKEALAWQLNEEVALKPQEVDGAVEADTAMNPKEVRIKKQASATEADITTEPDAAIEATRIVKQQKLLKIKYNQNPFLIIL